MPQLAFLLVGGAGALVHGLLVARPHGQAAGLEIALVWLLVWWYGAFCLVGGVMHLRESLASPVPAHVPFEYAFANFGIAAIAFLSVFLRGPLLVAVVVAGGVFYLGAALWDAIAMLRGPRPVSGQLWYALAADLLIPLVTLLLLLWRSRAGP
jgi:hypothetical protein